MNSKPNNLESRVVSKAYLRDSASATTFSIKNLQGLEPRTLMIMNPRITILETQEQIEFQSPRIA